MKIKIENDRVFNAETGELLEGVVEVFIQITPDSRVALLKVANPSICVDTDVVNIIPHK